jgi:Domain of unknown function (DUF4372)
MAFAQLTYRESLRDIEVCLSAQSSKLYHMGFREPVRRSTLADANETRDWRIYAEFAQRLVAQARKLYADESLGLELTNTVGCFHPLNLRLAVSHVSMSLRLSRSPTSRSTRALLQPPPLATPSACVRRLSLSRVRCLEAFATSIMIRNSSCNRSRLF